jgi:hypothetical protein
MAKPTNSSLYVYIHIYIYIGLYVCVFVTASEISEVTQFRATKATNCPALTRFVGVICIIGRERERSPWL